MARDQRYCLECGERRLPVSSVLQGGWPGAAGAAAAAAPAPPAGGARGATPSGETPPSATLLVIAGVGVLLLAMGVGVLIGRAGVAKQGSAAPAVITVGSVAGSGSGAAGASEASFTSSWPAGTRGYTVQLQTLPVSGTTVSAVEAAKSSATAKGAKAVGALKSEEFSSLRGSNYVIYSGVYHTRSDAQKALAGLKKSFAAASVIEVSSGGSSSSGSGNGGGTVSTPGGVGESLSKPAPPSVLEGLKGSKGKSYEEKSKALPNVVGT